MLVGRVVAIADGDTLSVLDSSKQQHKIRLEGIDALEQGQPFGTRAREALGEKVHEQTVRIEWEDRDCYGRILGHIYLGDRWINQELVAEGWAWHFKRYSDDKDLAAAEQSARKAKLGLWQDAHSVPPWEWRRGPAPSPGEDDTTVMAGSRR